MIYKFSQPVRYLAAAIVAGLALGLTWFMPEVKAAESSLLVLLLAVVLATWLFGWKAGLSTTALCTVGHIAITASRSTEFAPASVHLLVFLLLSLLILGLAVMRQAAEESLGNSETQLRAILENSLDPIAVSHNGIHQYVNPAYLRMFGYHDAGDLLGKSVLNVIAPDERLAIQRRVERRTCGEAVENSYETRGLRADGGNIDMEVHVSTYRLQNELLSLVILRDITGRKRALQEKEHLISELRDALSKVKLLHGLLPTCAGCHKIRNEEGEWEEMETYISEHSDVDFSHGLCPNCAKRLYPEVFDTESDPSLTNLR